MMRLNRFMAASTGISRRQADKLISGGTVTINGNIATLGSTVKDSDCVKFNGQILNIKTGFINVLLNKPVGYVCSRQGQGSLTIYELIPKEYWQLKPAGRLDKDSSGLVLLTDDGQLIYNLTHPKTNKSKIYEVHLNKQLDDKDLTAITNGGVTLEDGVSRFAIEPLISKNCSWKYKIIMHEGRNRQIRRTFETLGYKVEKLHRTQIGDYKLDDLVVGKYKLVDDPK
jgi:pseudouridine synthase